MYSDNLKYIYYIRLKYKSNNLMLIKMYEVIFSNFMCFIISIEE